MSNNNGVQEAKGVPINSDDIKTVVTEVKITPVRTQHNLVAIASCVIDNKFFVGSLGLYSENGKYRLTYPTKKLRMSSMTIFHPINMLAGDAVFSAIVSEYEHLLTHQMEEDQI